MITHTQETIQLVSGNKLIYIKNSEIHGSGVFATKDITKGTKIIEYIGEKISKEESDKRQEEQEEIFKKDNSKGAVYIFELDDEYDIDGNFEYNHARLINHSCSPNCQYEMIDHKIWIVAKRDIKEGEELSYNYGFDLEDYKDHPCKCGSENCVGYILDEDYWSEIKKSS